MNFLENNTIQLDKVGRCKKLTATRFATIFNLNAWNTPFSAWCEITKTYDKPFEESQYTLAGKIIEGKIINYLNKRYFMELKTPTDVYGEDYFKKTYGDFFKENKIFGGMWDALGDDFVVEIKTTKRAEDWSNDVPIYYKLQAALYTYLLGFDKFIVPVCFLSESDYPTLKADGTWDTTNADNFVPSIDNMKIYTFYLSEEFPNFKEEFIDPAEKWWAEHVVAGISPAFDETKDAEILKALRKNTIEPTDEDIKSMLDEADSLQDEIDSINKSIEEKADRLKEVNDLIKKYMSNQFRENDNKVEIQSNRYVWNLTKSNKTSIDSTRLKKDGLYDQYTKTCEVLTLRKSLKEDK